MAQQTTAADPNREAREQELERGREARAKSYAEFEARTQGVKPTPTQDENDRAVLGEHILEHEPDGSPVEEANSPDPYGRTRMMEAGKGSPYQTRAAQPHQPGHEPPRQPQQPPPSQHRSKE